MSCENENVEYWRLVQKYSTISGVAPTIPPSQDHSDGTWSDTDLYIGEFFMNVSDNLLWYRTIDGIHLVSGATGASGSFVGDYVPTSGGTYSGGVFAPTFSSNTITSALITASAFDGQIFGSSGSVFYGDGSNLTGIVVGWNGGTVSNGVDFVNNVSFGNPIVINGPISTVNDCVDFQSDVCVNGGVSASYFIGDGSGLTGIVATYSDTYTTDAYLQGSSIYFDRTNGGTASYFVDLSPILATYSILDTNWDPSTSEFQITTNGGDTFTETINEFSSLNVQTTVTANQFYGTFNGTFSNDIYTTSATLYGTDAVFMRTDGASYSLDLSTLSTSGATGATGPAGATGATGSTPYMVISYTSTGLTLATGSVTLPITTTLLIGWSQGTRVRIWNDATHYMEGQITTAMTYPQIAGNNIVVNVDYVVGTGTLGVWKVGVAGDVGSAGAAATQTLEQTLQIGNTIGAESINFGGNAYIQANGTNIELKADGNVLGDLYLNSINVADDTSNGIEQISFSDISGVTMTSNITLTPNQTYEAHTINDISAGTDQTATKQTTTANTTELFIDQSTGIDTEYRRELGVTGTTNGSSVKVTDNNSFEQTEIKTDTTTITLSSSAAAGQTLANLNIISQTSNQEITWNVADTAAIDPYYSAIGNIGTQYTTIGNRYVSPNPGFPPFSRRGSLNTKSGAASGNETWAELRSGNTDESSYAFIRATDLGGAYPANIMEVGSIGVDWTKIEHNFNEIKIISNNPTFFGVQYDQDWSANFTNRTLVDKEYVDNAVGGPGITYSGQTDYVTFFDSNDSLSYTNMYYNSGRYTIGHGSGWVYDHYATFGVYSPYTTGPAIIGESSQFGGLFIASGAATGQTIGLQGQASGSTIQGNLGIYGNAGGTMSSNIGGYFAANDGTIYPGFSGFSNLGLDIVASSFYSTGAVGLTNSGININVYGRVGDNNYIGQLRDGSEGVGKVLTCVSADGLATWQTPTGGGGGSTASLEVLDTAVIPGYRRVSNTQKLYRLTRPYVGYSTSTTTINGESIYLHSFYCEPGSKINEIAFRIQTAGASGLGLAQCRILIYRSQLNANGEIVGGDLELDTNVNISTLTTGIKVITGLNHTLSTNTYKNQYFIGLRNYQSGSLSLKSVVTSDTTTNYSELSSSGAIMERDNGWYFSCLWNSATPASMPAVSATVPTTSAVAPADTILYMGISAT